MKKFLSGFLTGAIIFSMLGVFAVTYVANPVDFKVLVNGEEFVSDPPALEIEGRTYLPLRAMGDALGVPVNWNEELRQAEVGTTTTISYIPYAEKKWCPDFGRYVGITSYADIPSDDGSHTYLYKTKGITSNQILEYLNIFVERGYDVREIDTGYACANADRTQMMGIKIKEEEILILVY